MRRSLDSSADWTNTVRIAPALIQSLTPLLEAAYPFEGCGLLTGQDYPEAPHIAEAVPAANLEPVRGEDRFVLDPKTYEMTDRELFARNDGSAILGFYHSHPDGLARPSSLDVDAARELFAFARTYYVYLIVPVVKGVAHAGTWWRLDARGERFLELAVLQKDR